MNILAIGAHPDDLEYGCGGTLLKFHRMGHKIFIMVMSRGEQGGNPAERTVEQKKVAGSLGARIFWGNFRDTRIHLDKTLINKIESTIKKVKPTLIFVHYPEDTHQDHRNVSQATVTATRYIRNVLFYEVPTTVNFAPTVFVDIGAFMEKKDSLLKNHSSQIHATRVTGLSILESVNASAIFRGFQNRVKFAEGFVPLRLSLDFEK